MSNPSRPDQAGSHSMQPGSKQQAGRIQAQPAAPRRISRHRAGHTGRITASASSSQQVSQPRACQWHCAVSPSPAKQRSRQGSTAATTAVTNHSYKLRCRLTSSRPLLARLSPGLPKKPANKSSQAQARPGRAQRVVARHILDPAVQGSPTTRREAMSAADPTAQ
jgi:hypothetical protein